MASNTETQQQVVQGTSINQVLNQASADMWIMRYKWPILGVVIALVLAVLGHGYYRTKTEENRAKEAEAISLFLNGPLKNLEEKKAEATVVAEAAKKLIADSRDKHLIAPAILKATDLLSDKEAATALDLLTQIEGTWMNSHRPMALLISLRKAALQEDLGRDAEAMATLETQLQRQYKVLESKLYFDLGRLALKIGDKERAKKNFNHLLSTSGAQADEYAKMAKIYLQDIK